MKTAGSQTSSSVGATLKSPASTAGPGVPASASRSAANQASLYA
jgi:hypothetical protein